MFKFHETMFGLQNSVQFITELHELPLATTQLFIHSMCTNTDAHAQRITVNSFITKPSQGLHNPSRCYCRAYEFEHYERGIVTV